MLRSKGGTLPSVWVADKWRAVKEGPGRLWRNLMLNALPPGRIDHFFVIVNTSNAGTPMTDSKTAGLTVDLWEHACCVDYRNACPK